MEGAKDHVAGAHDAEGCAVLMASPVLGPMEETCQGVGRVIGKVLEDHAHTHPHAPRVGFALLMFTFGKPGWMTYVSNADREDIIKAMYEFIAKQPTEPQP